MPSSWRKLLEPGRIGSLELRNRIVMAPMGTNLAEPDGSAGPRLRRYYEERARGEVGLVTVGVGAIAYPSGAAIPRQLALSDDRFLPGLSQLVEAVHRHGARVAIQLQHAGKIATQDIAAGRPLLVPSLVPLSAGGLSDLTRDETERLVSNLRVEGARLRYHELSADDIRGLVASFAEAAERARRAGFDGVEIHAGHGYIVSAFLSRATNKRTDEYGGSAANRARLLVEVIRAVKDRAGSDFPVWCRMDAREYRIEDGITIEESCETARLAARAGADALHVSAYGNPASGIAFTEAPLVHEPGGYLGFAREIKQSARLPVIAVGRIEPDRAERALRDGAADFIAMGRKLLADPELPKKLREGRAEDVRPCVYCYTCVGNIFVNESVACAVNPATGREAELEPTKADPPRRVLVVGGGPAGLEAARVAALRGHHVTLCEKDRRLGGTLALSSLQNPPNGRLVRYLAVQLDKLDVDVRLGWEVTAERVTELRPDVMLVAVGAARSLPAIPGIKRPDVLSGDDVRALLAGGRAGPDKLSRTQRALLQLYRLLPGFNRPALLRMLTRLWLPLGRRVAVVGGGLVGLELAAFLSERGRAVTVLEEGAWLAPQMAIPRRWRALHELRERGATLLTSVRVEAIDDRGVQIVASNGERRIIATDHTILASGAVADSQLADALRDQPLELRAIGDCDSVRYLEGAIAAGHRAGLEV